ncbi:type II secretion system F family protein [Pseudobutyrivibrio sp.]|uniref:type II secretion system F family protein n=1 Tax=Pseudobutyrivibrio sp. TaxID=2014367 RepID=UPI001D23C2AB|nr:hypothetical protein [Pseudobutyrivibrio sp.]MBE5909896.1 hypothetical protein [Pseudobutyrivibrio sp.]
MQNNNLTVYYQCNMTKKDHITVYVLASFLAAAVVYLFYHLIIISVVLGLFLGYFLEKIYAQSTITKRQKKLLLEFRDFLENMSVAANAGDVEYKAILSARNALKQVYDDDADIIIEINNIINQYENGGRKLTDLFMDFANRSQLEDVKSFATIFSVIEGKSNNFGAIINQTYNIIGDKIEITEEIETAITSSKSETYTMLCMPIIIVIFMSALGSGFMDSLFTTTVGHIVATVALALFAASFVIAVKAINIKV